MPAGQAAADGHRLDIGRPTADAPPSDAPLLDEPGPCAETASLEALLVWVAEASAGKILSSRLITGGNRYQSWAVDIAAPDGRTLPLYLRHQMPRPPSAEPYTLEREAQIYRVIDGRGIRAPRLVAVHPDGQTVLSERVPGRAEFRRLINPEHRVTVVQDFVQTLADLHKLDIARVTLDGLSARSSMADCVAREIAVWQAMYEETHSRDPLIDLALNWLTTNMPRPGEPVVLVHGDAGPGNFLFEDGHMTALLDWELAHLGDPMEDIAWFSMRCVMEPVPGFGDRLAEYERAMGRPIDRFRVLYHRVLVSTRIVILRHRNVTGEPGNSIVSRGLNRRLLVDALAGATGVKLAPFVAVHAPETARAGLYDGIIADLRTKMADRSDDPVVVASAKNAAKVLKYLSACDRLGPAIEAADLAALTGALGTQPASAEEGQALVVQRLADNSLPIETVLQTFSGIVQRAAQLSAASSGGISGRTFPDLP